MTYKVQAFAYTRETNRDCPELFWKKKEIPMKIAFYSTKPYDRIWFEPMGKDYGFDIHFIELPCNEETVFLAKGYDANGVV